MSQETQNNLTPVEAAGLLPTTDVQERVNTMLANRKYLVEKVRPLLIETVDIYTLPGMKKPSLGKPGAEKLATIFGLVASFAIDHETMEAIGETANGKPYVAYVCNLTRNGQLAGQGRGATSIEWTRTNYKNMKVTDYESAKDSDPEFIEEDWKEMRGQYGTYYRKKDGTVDDPLALNKAIKMAQKSAFVDAVIRATGMSDLFTQDLEDVREEAQEPAPTAGGTIQRPATEVVSEFTSPVKDEPFPDVEPKEKSNAPICDLCGDKMVRRNGPRGPFWGCSNYPKCTNIKAL